jgi:hypothetical protein
VLYRAKWGIRTRAHGRQGLLRCLRAWHASRQSHVPCAAMRAPAVPRTTATEYCAPHGTLCTGNEGVSPSASAPCVTTGSAGSRGWAAAQATDLMTAGKRPQTGMRKRGAAHELQHDQHGVWHHVAWQVVPAAPAAFVGLCLTPSGPHQTRSQVRAAAGRVRRRVSLCAGRPHGLRTRATARGRARTISFSRTARSHRFVRGTPASSAFTCAATSVHMGAECVRICMELIAAPLQGEPAHS